MQEGIGRGGYRLLALLFTGLAGLGIIATLVAFEQEELNDFFQWLGFGLTTFGLFALLAVNLVVLAGPSAPRTQAERQPAPAREPEPEPELPEPSGATSDPGVEFEEQEPVTVSVAERSPAGPPPRPQPPPPPFVHPPQRPRDSKGWPERKGPTGLTRREMAAVAQALAVPELEGAPASKRTFGKEAPLVVARVAPSADVHLPDNLGIGKCGNCGVLLAAPKKRPIRLQCPSCDRVHTLG